MRQRLYCTATTLGFLFVVMLIGTPIWRPDSHQPEPRARWSEPDDSIDHPEETESKRAAVLAAIEAKQAVARDLALGRLTLLTAAARIRTIDHAAPHFHWEAFRSVDPSASDDERHCREAIGWVRAVLPDNEETDKRVRALEDELSGHLCEGLLRLPELP